MASAEPSGRNDLRLTDEHRMLLRMRDTLYEGSWGDFAHDLRAKIANRPVVFEVAEPSPRMRETIVNHLGLIAEMGAWEKDSGVRLEAQAE